MVFGRTPALFAFAAAVGWSGLVTEAAAQGSVTADRAALAALYDATGGADWENNTNWKTNAPLNQWYGVQTDTAGRVTVVNLGENHLRGPLPAALGDLTQVSRLSLWGNELTGALPSSMRNLGRLERLNLDDNALTGSLGGWLGDLPNLQDLLLARNGFTGPIPASLRNLRRLAMLNLGGNGVSGGVPTWLGDLSNLWFLALADNDLTGTIPDPLRDLDRLAVLTLGGNELTGSIPAWLGNLSQLRWLSLWGNEVTGTVPAALRNLDRLELLNLNGNKLTGALPTWLGDLAQILRVAEGTEARGTVRVTKAPVRIEDVIAAMGPRAPAADESRKEFRLGVYLLHDGLTPRPDLLRRARGISAAVAEYFFRATGGRMLVVPNPSSTP